MNNIFHQMEIDELKRSNRVLGIITIILSVLTITLSGMVAWLVLGGAS